LPISVALVWLTNPLTWIPLFYFAYLVGLWALNMPAPSTDFHFSAESVLEGLDTIGGPFLFGCFILSSSCAIAGYFGIRLFWRWHIISKWKKRRLARATKDLSPAVHKNNRVL
jgi:uncharacterized protein (DUF2062 family)